MQPEPVPWTAVFRQKSSSRPLARVLSAAALLLFLCCSLFGRGGDTGEPSQLTFPKPRALANSVDLPLDEDQLRFWSRHGVQPRATRSYFGIDKAYVIHYSALQERRDLMKGRLTRILGDGWNETNFVSFVTQLDMDKISDEDILDLQPESFQHENFKGPLSVAAKHHLAYFDALHHGYETIAVFEDDTDFPANNFGEEMLQVLQALPGDWSNCMLVSPWGDIGGPCVPQNDVVCRNGRGVGSNGAVAYLMSSRGCRQMMEALPGLTYPDHQMNKVSKDNPKFVTYRSMKNIAAHSPTASEGWHTWNRPK